MTRTYKNAQCWRESKVHVKVNNTKKQHHDMMYAICPPKANHTYRTYGRSESIHQW